MEDFKLSYLFRSQLDYNLRDSTMSKRTQNTSMPICCRNSSCKAQAFASLIPKFYKLQLICMMFSLIVQNLIDAQTRDGFHLCIMIQVWICCTVVCRKTASARRDGTVNDDVIICDTSMDETVQCSVIRDHGFSMKATVW